jgi:hypothetical protein
VSKRITSVDEGTRTREAREPESALARETPSAAAVIALQRSIGNSATARLLACRPTTVGRASGVLAIQRYGGKDDATASDEDMAKLGYDAITKAVGGRPITYKNIRLGPNGALFVELRDNTPKSDDVKSQREGYSYDEKLHVPTTADDIATRTDIVTRLCLEKGFTAFKTTRPEKMQNVQPGGPMIWQTLKDGGLTDDQAYDAGKGIPAYLADALSAGKREALHDFLEKRGRLPTDPSMYGDSLSLVLDGVVADSDVFPSEQRGREITIYIDPGFKPEAWWANFAKTLVAQMKAAGLSRLPIADGDQPVTGEGELVDGVFHAYFSSRDEAMAMDSVLQARGFPTWYGGNAQESRASGANLVFDKVDLDNPGIHEPGLDVDVDVNEGETTVNGQVQPGMLERFVTWAKSWFGY